MISMLAASALAVTGLAAQVQQPTMVNTTPCLVVTGSAEVRTTPDLAILSIGVTTQAKTAKDAQNEANTKTADFLSKVKRLLGEKGTVQTGSINLYPVYNQQNTPSDRPFTPQIVGYRADNTLSIRTTDFSLVGPAIDLAVESGLNNVQGVSFGLQDDTNARMEALGNAVKEARRKAEAMASAAGVTLAGIWEMSEQGARVMPFQMAGEAMMARAGAAPTPVEPGAVSVNGDVTIKFFLKS
jgi:uncharacterized protein